jgi:excisionase family DNA binding protein
MQNMPLLLTRHEAARALRISIRHFDALIASGEIPVVRISRNVRIRQSALEQFIEAMENKQLEGQDAP